METEKNAVQQLIALKRFEQPFPGFLNGVEAEFHKRLAQETLRRQQNSFALFWDRLCEAVFADPLRATSRLAMSGACAAVMLLAGVSFTQQISSTEAPGYASVTPASWKQLSTLPGGTLAASGYDMVPTAETTEVVF